MTAITAAPHAPSATCTHADVAVVIVLYHVDPQKVAARVTLQTAGARVVLVDNTPLLRSPAPDLPSNFDYLAFGENLGIARALNAGVGMAIAAGATIVVTFDQDSQFDAALLRSLVAKYLRLRGTQTGPLALGAMPRNQKTGASYLRRRDRMRRLLGRRQGDAHLLEVHELITSGLTADAATYQRIGQYRDDLFIDFVDHEWCWRLRAAGGRCFVSLDAALPHQVGDGDVPFTFGMKRGSPHRLFYLFRNGIYLIATGSMPVFDACKFLLLIPLKLVFFGVFFRDRAERIRHAWCGLVSGMRWALGRTGGGAG